MTNQTCTFTFEQHSSTNDSPSNLDQKLTTTEESSAADKIWECPHPVYQDGRCIFHSPPDQRESSVVRESLVECLTDESAVPEFRGAQFEELRLSETTIDRSDGATIDFSYAIVEGETDLSEATINADICFESATLRDEFDLSSVSLSGELDCRNAKFGDRIFLDDATFGGTVSFDHVESGFLSANGATFEADATFAYSSWTANASFATSVFEADLNLERSTFRRKLDLTRIGVDGTTTLGETTVGGETLLNAGQLRDGLVLRRGQFGDDVNLTHVSVSGDLVGDRATFEGVLALESGTYTDGCVSFEATQFEGGVHASEATFDGHLNCHRAVFGDTVWFVLADIAGSADFRGTTFHAGSPGAQSGVHFREVTYGGPALYSDAKFEDQSFFFNAEFESDGDFTDTTFRHFQFGATVAGETTFTGAEFNARAIFANSVFEGPALFNSATFEYSADFSGAVFESDADFYRTTFVRELDFDEAEFDREPIARNVDLRLEPEEQLRHTGESFDLDGEADAKTLELEFDNDHSDLAEDNPIRALNAKIDLHQMANRRASALLSDPLDLMQAAADHLPDEEAYYLIGVHLSKEASKKHDTAGHEDEFPTIVTDAMLFAVLTIEDNRRLSIAHMANDLERINYVIPVQPEQYPKIFQPGVDELTGGQLRAVLVATLDRRVKFMIEDEQRYVNEVLRPIFLGMSAFQKLNS